MVLIVYSYTLSARTCTCMCTCVTWDYTTFLALLQTLVQSLKQEGEQARTALKVLETLTYSCINPSDLHEITTKLEELILALREKLPKSEGIILRPEARKAARKRAQKISRKYRPLPSSVKRGRPRKDWRYQNRVGKKADELRKVIIQTFIELIHIYVILEL